MKFTDGLWMVREGYEIHFPHMVYDVDVTEDALTLYAPTRDIPTRDIVHRGATLNCPLILQ